MAREAMSAVQCAYHLSLEHSCSASASMSWPERLSAVQCIAHTTEASSTAAAQGHPCHGQREPSTVQCSARTTEAF
eukprot:1161909-Pelagomonas_calceolata.AAC.9